jgi:hypothetical protein
MMSSSQNDSKAVSAAGECGGTARFQGSLPFEQEREIRQLPIASFPGDLSQGQPLELKAMPVEVQSTMI